MSLSPSQALLLVDGYNVIGAWDCLKKTRDYYGLESARRELVETLINYTAHQNFNTRVVFDAHYQKTPSSSESHTPYLSVYYTAFAQTADTYIEKVCASFRNQVERQYSRLIVATSDRAERLTIVGYGAEWMSVQKLAQEIDTAACKIKDKRRPQKQSRGRFLFNSLDVKSQQRLKQWQEGQKEK